MGLLEKIAWRTRKWNLKINILDIFIHDGDGCWGFTFLEVVHNFKTRALLAFEFRLPNGETLNNSVLTIGISYFLEVFFITNGKYWMKDECGQVLFPSGMKLN